METESQIMSHGIQTSDLPWALPVLVIYRFGGIKFLNNLVPYTPLDSRKLNPRKLSNYLGQLLENVRFEKTEISKYEL